MSKISCNYYRKSTPSKLGILKVDWLILKCVLFCWIGLWRCITSSDLCQKPCTWLQKRWTDTCRYLVSLVYLLNIVSIYKIGNNSLQKERKVTRKQLQLVGVTALYVAAKFEEVCTPTVIDFSAVSDNAFSSTEVRHMEKEILQSLEYDLAPPPAVFFLRRFSKAAGVMHMYIHMQNNKCQLIRMFQFKFGSLIIVRF